MNRISIVGWLLMLSNSCLADCELRSAYTVETQTRESRQESIADFYTRWHARLIVAMNEQLDEECHAWVRGELLALCNALRDDARSLELARHELQTAASCRARLAAGNHYVAAWISVFGRDADREQQLECRAAALIALEGCPSRDDLLSDVSSHSLLTHAIPMLHVVASTEADSATREQSLRDLLAFVERAQRETPLQLNTDHRNVLCELALMLVDTDRVADLRPLLDSLGDGARGKARAALALITRRGILQTTATGEYLYGLVLNSNIASLRVRLLSKQHASLESGLDGRQDAPSAEVEQYITAQQSLLACSADCRTQAANNQGLDTDLDISTEQLGVLEANARYEVYAKARWYLKDQARATQAANEFLAAFPADNRAQSVLSYLAGE